MPAAYDLRAFCKLKQVVEFQKAARLLNKSEHCNRSDVTWIAVRDRFFRIIKSWKISQSRKKAQYAIEEEVTEQDEIMANIISILNDVEEYRKTLRDADNKKKEVQKKIDETFHEFPANRRVSCETFPKFISTSQK